jgi:flavin reductase
VLHAPQDATAACRDTPPPERLKDALARLASGVALIACWDNGTPRGLVATSLIGLSVDPARLLFSVRHEASAHDALLAQAQYTATILAEADRAEAELFASPAGAAERFNSARWRLDDAFAPRFRGGLVNFDLRTERWIRGPSNTIFIAEALAVEGGGGTPLLYFERSFASLAPGQG